jgi:hypothetical protein
VLIRWSHPTIAWCFQPGIGEAASFASVPANEARCGAEAIERRADWYLPTHDLGADLQLAAHCDLDRDHCRRLGGERFARHENREVLGEVGLRQR